MCDHQPRDKTKDEINVENIYLYKMRARSSERPNWRRQKEGEEKQISERGSARRTREEFIAGEKVEMTQMEAQQNLSVKNEANEQQKHSNATESESNKNGRNGEQVHRRRRCAASLQSERNRSAY